MAKAHEMVIPESNSALRSSLKTLIVTMVIVFACEALIMVIIPYFNIARSIEILVDPILLALMTAPILSVVLLKPLRRALEEQRKSEREVNAAREAALKATEAKSRFLSHMSHEIRTPLNGVVGMADLLLETELTPEQTEYAETIGICSDQLLTLINDILDMSKIEAGKLDLESIDFDIRQIAEEARGIVAATVGDSAVKFLCRVAPEVPECLRGDPLRVRQILINLTNNAVKFSKDGEINVIIEVAEDSLSHVVLKCSVKDSGVGIPEEKLSDLFREFSQIGSETGRQYGGTGLGLAISKQLTELMGGKIGVTSKLGQGSTFWFTARLEKSSGEPCRLDIETHEPAKAWKNGERRPERILLADDNPINRRHGVLLLEKKLGFQVDAVSNGFEVLDALRTRDYDLVLMDCEMPGMDGLEATRVIRDPHSDVRNHDIPIVALTARAMKGEQQECRNAGMVEFVTKPIDAKILAGTIDRLVLVDLAK